MGLRQAAGRFRARHAWAIHRLKGVPLPATYVDVHVVEHCNLNCRGCAHFSPVAEPCFLDPADFERSLIALAPLFDTSFSSLHLLGGEPLLHPQLSELMRLARRHLPQAELQVITNGTLIPRMGEDFWAACRETRAVVYVSEYPVDMDYKAVLALLTQHGVEHRFDPRSDFICHVFDPRGTQDPHESWRRCQFGGTCVQLVGTRLYACPRCAYADHVNRAFGESLRHERGDWLELSDATPLRLYRFLDTPKPFCRYCDLSAEHTAPWAVSRRERSEWFGTGEQPDACSAACGERTVR